MNQKELFKTSTSSAEAFHANRSVLQARKKARKMTDTSGRTCMKLLNTKNPLGSLSKTLVASSMWHSMMCVLTWKPKVTPRNRLLFQLAVSKLPIEETESGSSERTWRTPDAHCGRGGSSKERMQMKLDKGMPISLNDQVAHPDLMWPTPASRDWKGGSPGTIKEDKSGKPYREAKNSKTKWGLTLDAAVVYQQKKMFPTPAARDYKDTGENTDYEKLAKKSKLAGAVKSKMYPTPRSSIGMSMSMDTVVKTMDSNDRGYKGNLEERVAIEQKMWPTPNASDNRDRGNMSDPAIQRRIAKGKQVGLTMAVKDKPGKGTLNPEWVEWLMGYPPGWTDISDSQ